MNQELNPKINNILISNKNHKMYIQSCKITLLNRELIVYRNGKIKRKMKSGKWKEINNNINHNSGYNVIMINKKQFLRSQIVAHIYLKYDMFNKEMNKNKMIIFKDKNKMNCSASNLSIVRKTYYLHEE